MEDWEYIKGLNKLTKKLLSSFERQFRESMPKAKLEEYLAYPSEDNIVFEFKETLKVKELVEVGVKN